MSIFVQEVVRGDLAPTAAAGSTPSHVLGEAQFDGVVTEATLISEAALTAADATARTLTIYNRGQDGSGTTVVATLVTNLAGGNWTANDEIPFTLTATAADREFSAGDVFECVETVAGAGTARAHVEVVVRGTRR